MIDVDASDFLKVSKALKHTRPVLRKELHAGLRRAAKPLIKDVRAAARTELPQRGGLAARMAKRPQRIRVLTGANPGVSVVMPKTQPGYLDGVIRHPVFGKKIKGKKSTARWVTQRIDGGWFDDTIRNGRPRIEPELAKAVQAVIDEIVRSAR